MRRLVRDALRSTAVAEAVAPHWREVYTCAPVEGRLLEGYIDLLYRGVPGLVVVDYKPRRRTMSRSSTAASAATDCRARATR